MAKLTAKDSDKIRSFEFRKDGTWLADKATVGIEASVSSASPAALALARNRPFPPGTVKLGTIAMSVKGGAKAIRFGGDVPGVVSFSAEAGTHGGIAAYATAEELRRDLDPAGTMLDGLDLSERGVARFVVLNWGYDIAYAARGSVALGAGSGVKFGAGGQREGFFAVIRAFTTEPKARDAVQSTLAGWMLPSQVRSDEQLAPGTWLVAEVDGEFAVNLGAQFGCDYSWIRNCRLSGLSGDVGLRIQNAFEATIRFAASGKYLLTVARESTDPSDKVIRVALSKMARKGWDFALNASLGVSGRSGKFLPGDLDEFAAAVFGIHGAQLVEDLKTFREWTNPEVPLPDVFAGFVAHYTAARLDGYVGDRLAEARMRIQTFLDQWERLPHRVSSLLWAELRSAGGPTAEEFEAFLRALASPDDTRIRRELEDALAGVDFFDTPAGRWLESVVTEDLLAALTDTGCFKAVREAAATTLALLDGEVLEDLVRFADENLSIGQVRAAVDLATLDKLEPWLKKILAEFLDGKPGVRGLEQIRKTLAFIHGQANQLYEAALKALHRKYEFSLAWAYSRATTKTAMLDVGFDLGRDPTLADSLASVINGDWETVLLTARAGIRLKKAVLTHGIRRRSHLEVTLPYLSGSIGRITDSLARMTVAEDGGRLLVYELEARDEVGARRKWLSHIAITSRIVACIGPAVRVFATRSELDSAMTCGYRFRLAVPEMHAVQLHRHVKPLIPFYFPRSFGGAQSPEKASLDEWVSDLDKHADLVENNGTGRLGNTLLALEVSLPGRVAGAWLDAPGTARDTCYMEMSRNLQRALRKIIPLCYFQDARRYAAAEFGIAAQLLVYQALPVSTSVSLNRGKVRLDTDRDVYWDYLDYDIRRAMIFNENTKAALLMQMEKVRGLLADIEGLREFAGDYESDNLEILRCSAFTSAGNDLLTRSLLYSEAETIRHAREAGLAMSRFHGASRTDPAGALETLAEFGEKVTGAFNSGLSDLFKGQGPGLRELGALLLVEAARAFVPGLKAETHARLEVILLRSACPKTWAEDFLAGKRPDPGTVSLCQNII